MFQALLVSIAGTDQITGTVESGTLPAPSSRPVRLDLGGLLSILQGILPVLLGSIGGRPVAVEDVVVGVDFNSFGEGIT